MATTPVMTTSDPNKYAQYKDQVSNVLYSKNLWADGNATGNEGLKTWAASNADNYYKALPKELSNAIHGMDNNSLSNFYNQLITPPPPTALDNYKADAGKNPYDPQATDMLTELKGMRKTVNPYDEQMKGLLAQLAGAINTPIADPTTTVQFKAAQERLNKEKGVSINDASEVLGGSGLARSSIVTDRAQEIGQQFTNYMETQVLPGIVQQLQQEKQSNISNLNTLITGTSNEAGRMDDRSKAQFDQAGKIYDAIVGQQGAWDKKVQEHFDNSIKQDASTRDDRRVEIETAKLELDNINTAMEKTKTLGYVSAEDADILGVAAGTPSFQAAEAVAKRKFDLETQTRDIASQEKMNTDRIAGSWRETEATLANAKEIAQKNREATKKGEDYRVLISLWETQGTAPPGLEIFGIPKGTVKGQGPLLPSQLLDKLKLEQANGVIAENTARDKAIPDIQKQFGVDKVTAGYIIDVSKNPTREAALADLKSSATELKGKGVNLQKIQEAIDKQWAPAPGEGEPLWKKIIDGVGSAATNLWDGLGNAINPHGLDQSTRDQITGGGN